MHKTAANQDAAPNITIQERQQKKPLYANLTFENHFHWL